MEPPTNDHADGCFELATEPSPDGLFQLSDGRFQLLSGGPIAPLMIGPGYVLAERRLADLLAAMRIPGLARSPAVIFARRMGVEHATHDQLHIEARHTIEEFVSLPFDGRRVALLHDRAIMVSREVRDRLDRARLPDLKLTPGLPWMG